MKEIYVMKNTTELLREKKEHLEQLLALSQHQADHIDQEDLEDLLKNIEEKQKRIIALESLQSELNGRKRASVEDAQLAVEINALVKQITEIDRGNQQMVKDRMIFVRSQMTKVAQGRRRQTGYAQRGGPSSTFDLNR